MSSYLNESQLRKLVTGEQLVYSWTLPASATTNNLFTVSTGNVLVTYLFGVVTTAVGATATTLALGFAPSGVGTAKTAGIASATAVTSSEVGVTVAPGVSAVTTNIVAPAQLAVGSFAGFVPTLPGSFVVQPGSITATTSANAGGGVIEFYLGYVCLDSNASVVVA